MNNYECPKLRLKDYPKHEIRYKNVIFPKKGTCTQVTRFKAAGHDAHSWIKVYEC